MLFIEFNHFLSSFMLQSLKDFRSAKNEFYNNTQTLTLVSQSVTRRYLISLTIKSNKFRSIHAFRSSTDYMYSSPIFLSAKYLCIQYYLFVCCFDLVKLQTDYYSFKWMTFDKLEHLFWNRFILHTNISLDFDYSWEQIYYK